MRFISVMLTILGKKVMFDGISEICDFDQKSGFCPPKIKNLNFVRNVLFRLRNTKNEKHTSF